jgi:diacylglycerol kinase (ATP)
MDAARPLLIVNPSSGGMGGARAQRRFVAAVERSLGDVDIQATERRGHAVDLARRGALEGRGVVVAVGGDGTLNEVVNGVLQARGAASSVWAPAATSDAASA